MPTKRKMAVATNAPNTNCLTKAPRSGTEIPTGVSGVTVRVAAISDVGVGVRRITVVGCSTMAVVGVGKTTVGLGVGISTGTGVAVGCMLAI